MEMKVPDKPSLEGLELKWGEVWDKSGIYRFDKSKTRDQVFSVDTPPPTVSGSLHVGHAMSYTHTDLIVRFQRMRGKEIFYPMGWDDNGLPTERRVQNYFGVRCDPSLPYDANFTPPSPTASPPISISRPNFIELCNRLTAEDEKVMEEVWRFLGLSVDWSQTYATIDERSRRASQRSFLRLLQKGLAYKAEAPTYWDVDFQTAVAQAELEDREITGAYHRIKFRSLSGGGEVEIETSRPELIPACVALVAHPDDSRYRDLFESSVATPLFSSPIPVLPHRLADPEKGTGIAMICTFGDVTDVTWWRELALPLRPILRTDGTLKQVTWGTEGWASLDSSRAQRHYNELTGLTARKAQKRIVEMLAESGDLVGEPVAITHPVKFFEKGDRPLEIITSWQWYIRTLEYKEELIRRGREMAWHPDFMRLRYEDWITGLNIDWGISRQRYFGVSFPVWYRLNEAGEPDFENPLLADEGALPVDPSTDVPPGYAEEQRSKPGGFAADPDVMDTWATSALTPQIAGGWEEDSDLFEGVFPMDLRPQAHDIIRTWLFVSMVRSHFEHGVTPWKNAAISGFITDPDRKKMSKSKGNVVTPFEVLKEHGTDAFRYWAAQGRPGFDLSFDPSQMKIGRRLAIKILNASRFVLSFPPGSGDVTAALDRSMIKTLGGVAEDATQALEDYDYTRALERTESFFWTFCDDYLELVKSRAYGAAGEDGARSAKAALMSALGVFQRLFAPFMPYVTEEAWSWWQEGSVHRAPWPDAPELLSIAGTVDERILASAARALGEIRRAKTNAKLSLKAEVKVATFTDSAEGIAALGEALQDIASAGTVKEIQLREADEFSAEVLLA